MMRGLHWLLAILCVARLSGLHAAASGADLALGQHLLQLLMRGTQQQRMQGQ